jgi:hypothetical protein
MPLEELAVLQNRMLGPRVPRADWRETKEGSEQKRKKRVECPLSLSPFDVCTLPFQNKVWAVDVGGHLGFEMEYSVPEKRYATVKHQAMVEQ